MNDSLEQVHDPGAESAGRREFLKGAGRFAAATPPAVVFLLSTSIHSSAIARSAGALHKRDKEKEKPNKKEKKDVQGF